MTIPNPYNEQLTESIIQSFEILEVRLQKDGCWELFNESDSNSEPYFYNLSVPTSPPSKAVMPIITDIRVYNNRIAATARLPFNVNGLVEKQFLMYTANEIFGKCVKSHGISFSLSIDYEFSNGDDFVTLEYEPDNKTEKTVFDILSQTKKSRIMAMTYSFKSNVNELFNTHEDAYVAPTAEAITRSIELLKENLRNSNGWSVGNSDTDGTYFSIVQRIPTMQFRGVDLDSTVVFSVYKHRIHINIKLPFNANGSDALRRLSEVANNAFEKSAMPCDFPITVTLKFVNGYEFFTMEYTLDEEETKE